MKKLILFLLKIAPLLLIGLVLYYVGPIQRLYELYVMPAWRSMYNSHRVFTDFVSVMAASGGMVLIMGFIAGWACLLHIDEDDLTHFVNQPIRKERTMILLTVIVVIGAFLLTRSFWAALAGGVLVRIISKRGRADKNTLSAGLTASIVAFAITLLFPTIQKKIQPKLDSVDTDNIASQLQKILGNL